MHSAKSIKKSVDIVMIPKIFLTLSSLHHAGYLDSNVVHRIMSSGKEGWLAIFTSENH